LPFLRFTRDKRGYETTSLVHSFRGRHGRMRQKLLYWFRTPPNVKVGRPALDEDAIRWIEEHNPDIDFDWPKILEATPPPAPAPEEGRGRRPQQRDKAGGRGKGSSSQRKPQQPVPQEAPPEPPSKPIEAVTPFADKALEESVELPEQQALEQLTHPDAEELPPTADTPPPIEAIVGHEQLIRLRARFAELQARIVERGGEPARIEALRAQAEPLNPDNWVTAEDAKTGLEQFEARIRDLRAALGLRHRRRSRRGGRRRRRNPQTPATPAETSEAPSNRATKSDEGE
jgi:hypothetical protein